MRPDLDCSEPKCKKTVPFPNGDSSAISRNDGIKPNFFCSEDCATRWDQQTRECIVENCTNLVLDGAGCACDMAGHSEKAASMIHECCAGIPG